MHSSFESHLAEYKAQLDQLPYGKRLPGAVYFYREPNSTFGEALDSLLAGVTERCQITAEFNVIKFKTDELKVSFLSYPDFMSEAHPALRLGK